MKVDGKNPVAARTTGHIHSIETFGLVDGPGVRYVVFLQGCRMRCRYCHNSETWALDAGETKTAQEVFDQAYRYHNYWKKNGGITVSGGEPLLQTDFVAELFALAKQKGIHTVLDTAGSPFTREEPFYGSFCRLMEVTDLVMLDIKEMDAGQHRELTGQDNQNILDMADDLSGKGKEMWIRHVLVPGLTDSAAGLRALRERIDGWKTVSRVEVLPYHTLGLFKWEGLGITYPLAGVHPPTEEEVLRAEQILGIR